MLRDVKIVAGKTKTNAIKWYKNDKWSPIVNVSGVEKQMDYKQMVAIKRTGKIRAFICVILAYACKSHVISIYSVYNTLASKEW